jgi:hypothetical protein
MHDVRNEMKTFYQETASKSKGGGWRAVGEKIGKSGAYARQIVNGQRPVTEEIAVAWMLSNGWHQRLIPVPACPDCGSVHHARCNGNGGHAVVLAPGETVRRPGQSKPRSKVRRPWMGAELTAEMDKAGVSDATVRWLVTRYIFEKELAGREPGLEGSVEVQP